nr:MAG: ORF1 [TTV-like mini virus]
MPWFYPRNNWYRRRRYRFRRRPRRFIRRRWRRKRNWVRTKRKKLKKILLTEYQPASIRKCKIKGKLPLFETDKHRITNNFEMYELSIVPEKLSGGGGWSLKLLTLGALYSEHEYCRNIWTHTNKDHPLTRYTGCTIKIWQPKDVDLVFSYSVQMPMESTLEMYQSMQPSIHAMMPHHKIIPSRQTYPKKKPYYKFKISPPKPFINKWYFQQDITKTPLLLTKATAISLQDYYLAPNSPSTNVTINILNIALLKNRNFKTPPNPGYYISGEGTNKVYLYSTRKVPTDTYHYENPTAWLDYGDVIPLYDTNTFTEGMSYNDYVHAHGTISHDTWKTTWYTQRGNPFNNAYLDNECPVYQSQKDYSSIIQTTNWDKQKVQNFTQVHLTQKIRYNPYNDTGYGNMCYFLSIAKQEMGWEPPEKPELVATGLPLWLLLFGFADWQKKLKKLLHLDTDYVILVKSPHTLPIKQPFLMLNETWIQGQSPQEEKPNPEDAKVWHPQFQFQQLIYNDICASGPGIVRLPEGKTVEAIMDYTFYFKWGGNPPQMEKIKDPADQPTFPLPRNELDTNSLQNPAIDARTFLYQFDERRGQITEKAAKRLRTDYSTEKPFITDGEHHLSVPLQKTSQETSETSSEEEETETCLLEQLQQQYQQQQQLKRRILKTMHRLQKLE